MHSHTARWLRTVSALGALSLALVSTPADAKRYKTAFPKHSMTVQGNGSAVDNVNGKQVPRALLNFHIDYASGHDTTIRDIGFDLIDNRLFRPWLGDADARSPFTATAVWRDLSKSKNVEYQHLTARCRQEVCDIGAAVRTGGKIPLLAGFSFHNLSGSKKIERMGVYPKTRNGWISYEARYKAPGRTNYIVDLHIVLVDPDIVADDYSGEANSRDGENFARVPLEWKKTGLLALQGFDVRYRNGAHHLQEFAVQPLKGTNAHMGVYLNDKNDDDPTWAKLWWVDLKAPGVKVIPMDKPLPQHKPKGPTPQLDPKVNPGPANKGSSSKGKSSKGNSLPTLPKDAQHKPNKLPNATPKFPL